MAFEINASIGKGSYKTELSNGRKLLIADESESSGGDDAGFEPNELFLSSLAACKAITMRMYADRKGWPLEGVNINLNLEVKKGSLQQESYINVNIELLGDLTDEQKQRILIIADKCPVHKVMQNPIIINSNLVDK